MTDEPTDDLEPTPASGGGLLLPLITAGVALAVGAAIGAVGLMAVWQPEVKVEQVPRELTEAEIEAVCNPFITDTLSVLTEAQAKVVELEDQVAAKEAAIVRMEAEADQRTAAGKKLWAQLQDAKAELESLRAQLATAVAEKEAALEELERTVAALKQTEDKLEETQGKLTAAQADVLDKRWVAFKQDAQLEICEKGGRRKMGKCREAVLAILDADIEKDYRHCVKSGQAVPGLAEATKDMTDLPDYSDYLNEDDRILKGWYLTLCDPTLPEAEDFSQALRAVQKAEGGTNAGGPTKEAVEGIDEALRATEEIPVAPE